MNEKKYKRIFTVVIDSLGAGEMPDAASYGDAGTDTLGHIAANVEEFKIPNLQKLGIANLKDLAGVAFHTFCVFFFGFYFLIFLCAFFFARYLHAKKDTVAFSFTYRKTTVSFIFKNASGTAPGSSPLLF